MSTRLREILNKPVDLSLLLESLGSREANEILKKLVDGKAISNPRSFNPGNDSSLLHLYRNHVPYSLHTKEREMTRSLQEALAISYSSNIKVDWIKNPLSHDYIVIPSESRLPKRGRYIDYGEDMKNTYSSQNKIELRDRFLSLFDSDNNWGSVVKRKGRLSIEVNLQYRGHRTLYEACSISSKAKLRVGWFRGEDTVYMYPLAIGV